MAVKSRNYALYVLALLTGINFINYVDRMVIVAMYDDLRRVFGLSDGQIGLLSTGFFTVFALTTIPFGWASDRWDRRKIMAAGVIAWSLATLGTVWAVGFISLFALRAAIGVGEAAYGPVSNALLCEVFPPSQKARTVAIYNGGMFAGACVGIGIGSVFGFPLAFKLVAVPGLLLGVMAWRLKVPPLRAENVPGAAPPTVNLKTMLKDGLRAINVPTLRWMLLSGILISFAAGGYISWFVDFVINFKSLPKKEATLVYGLIAVSGGSIGTIVGGIVADRLYRKYRHGRVLTIAIGFLAAVPFSFGAVWLDVGAPFYIASFLLMFFMPWYNGPMAAVIDDVVDDDQASTAQATFSFMLHLFGTGPSSAVVGFASSMWVSRLYDGHGQVSHVAGLPPALMLPTLAVLLAGLFALRACRHVDEDMRARDARRRQPAAERQAA